MAGTFDRTTSGVFKPAILCDKDTVESLSTLLKGSRKVHGRVAVVLAAGASGERCPGQHGNAVVFNRVHFRRIYTDAQQVPAPAVRQPLRQSLRRLKQSRRLCCTCVCTGSTWCRPSGTRQSRRRRQPFTRGQQDTINMLTNLGLQQAKARCRLRFQRRDEDCQKRC